MRTIAVSELVHYLKYQIDTNDSLQNILVMGEISNFTHHFSGHLYFSLKDDNARISCVMFRSQATRLLFEPKNGDRVLIKAKTSIFEASGQLQLYVSEMKLDGIGDLYLKYEALKNKLSSEGYFDPEHKKPVPKYPMKLAILVGDKSAALSDIKTTLNRRWPIAKYDVYPVLVQGNGSSEDIIAKLKYVDELNYDAIVLARGGGSIEDLWSFNDENLAKTIYNLKTFIITGVGHEQDYTIADFVADLRAPTPTASIELLTPKIDDVISQIIDLENRAKNALVHQYELNKQSYQYLLNSRVFKSKYYILEKDSQKLDYLISRLLNVQNRFSRLHGEIDSQCQSALFAISKTINDNKNIVNQLLFRLDNACRNILVNKHNQVKRNLILLDAYGYENTLRRGYSLAFKEGKIIKDIEQLKVDDLVEIKINNGSFKAEVKEVKHAKG